VLDIACGAGLFLELLAEHGIDGLGVERNPTVVNLVRSQGWRVIEADAFTFLAETTETYDGVFCSHFIEHLPFERVLKLIECIVPLLTPGGTFVLVFPNPESIRMQLFGFWRDPEHVRFYHPELIEAVCTHYGLTVAYSNRQTAPFALSEYAEPPQPSVTDNPAPAQLVEERKPGLRELLRRLHGRLLRALRIASTRELVAVETRLRREHEAAAPEFMRWAKQTTWALNRMWSWPDNAMIVCRKPAER
jgi:O-antigen chain-terminating methyltransferase